MSDDKMDVLAAALRSRIQPISEEEWKEKEALHERDMGFHPSQRYQTWRPSEKAGHTPKPLLMRPKTGKEFPTWDDYLIEENFDKDWVILGAGAGALQHAHELDGKVVYGINWTTRWFPPTFMQVMDGQVWQEEIRSPRVRKNEDTQIVASKWISYQRCFNEEERKQYLHFDLVHPALKDQFERLTWADGPDDLVCWGPNSLVPAINIVSWFRPRRVALVGFDFGGPHFFGDGSVAGCSGDYGFKSANKQCLHGRLRWLKEQAEERGMVLRHVRPTRLDVFKQVDSVAEAME